MSLPSPPTSSSSSSSSSSSLSPTVTKSSIYPLHPPGSKVLLRVSETEFTTRDRFVVVCSSLFFVGGVFWVPALYFYLVRKYRSIPPQDKRRRVIYGALLVSLTALYAVGPHRNPKVGDWVRVHKWSLWKSWFRFFAFEVVADEYDSIKDLLHNQAILGISPHGVFPFGLAFAALTEQSAQAFGTFRAVVASATQLIPWVRDVLRWVRAVDASRPSVDQALKDGYRIGLAPGGIAEIFQTPKSDKEYAIIRKGIFRLAVKHQVPLIPIYCFGSSMLLRRLKLHFIEKVSLMLRISLVVFFGKWGLPVPFRQRLLYVIGKPVHPPQPTTTTTVDQQVDLMYRQYCQELLRVFDRHKESYASGWEDKSLAILTE